MAVVFADIFMSAIETEITSLNWSGKDILTDDIFSLWNIGKKDIDSFITDSTIKFTAEI